MQMEKNEKLNDFNSKSISLRIQLETDFDSHNSSNEDTNIDSFYSRPPTAVEVIPVFSHDIRVHQLPRPGIRQIELFLNLPAYGSMLNWEFLAADLGLTNLEIMNMRSSSNPTSVLLERFSNSSLSTIIDALSKIGRLDILIAIRPFICELIRQDSSVISDLDSGAYVSECDSIQTRKTDVSSVNNMINARKMIFDSEINNHNLILVVHHEVDDSEISRKHFKWLMKNLRKHAEISKANIVDANSFFDSNDPLAEILKTFEYATHIVCVFSEDYLKMLTVDCSMQALKLKKYIHNLMNAEYAESGGVNKRFRVVLTNGVKREVLPVGWPRNTIVYEFPANYQDLSRKLFR